jgi:hypothetical protein
MAIRLKNEVRSRARVPIHRTRAAAGMGSACVLWRQGAAGAGRACGPGASPTPDLREPARAVPRTRKYRRAARRGCSGARWSHVARQQQPRALLEKTGLQSRPTTDGSTETPTTDAHVCATRFNPTPVFQVQSILLRAPTTDLAGPVATPAPCGVICHLQPAWIK